MEVRLYYSPHGAAEGLPWVVIVDGVAHKASRIDWSATGETHTETNGKRHVALFPNAVVTWDGTRARIADESQ